MSFFQRARASVFGETPPPPQPQPGSLLDTAKQQVDECAGRAYNWIYQRSPWVAARIDNVVVACSELESRGYTKHFGEFNNSLLKPLTTGLDDVVRVVRATATCAPEQDARAAFELWNVLCFWLSVAIALINMLLPFGSAVVEIIGALLRYISAYTLHFCIIRQPQRRFMVVSLVVLGLYVSSCVFSAIAGLVPCPRSWRPLSQTRVMTCRIRPQRTRPRSSWTATCTTCCRRAGQSTSKGRGRRAGARWLNGRTRPRRSSQRGCEKAIEVERVCAPRPKSA